jgi:hypothetical protein
MSIVNMSEFFLGNIGVVLSIVRGIKKFLGPKLTPRIFCFLKIFEIIIVRNYNTIFFCNYSLKKYDGNLEFTGKKCTHP